VRHIDYTNAVWYYEDCIAQLQKDINMIKQEKKTLEQQLIDTYEKCRKEEDKCTKLSNENERLKKYIKDNFTEHIHDLSKTNTGAGFSYFSNQNMIG
jgi:septal ring factor EnvC (AmiA/AmiB activator)